jgi:nitrate/nitrite-specific signal transduction histidine kinase
MTDLKNILNHDDELDSEELIRYLQGNASEEERFSVEKQMADSSFVNEAMEGLQNFKDPEQVKDYVDQLNKQLQKHTAKKVSRKKKRRLKDENWLIIAILAILLLCITGYLLIHFYSIRH